MKEFVSEKELKKLIESGFNCKIDYMRLEEGYLALIAKIGNDINFELDYDREKFFPNTITGMVDRCKYDTYFSEPKDVEKFLGDMLSSVADEYGFRYTREWVNGVNVSNVFKALEMIRNVVNNEAILDEGKDIDESLNRHGRVLKEDVGEKYELTDEMTKLEKVEAVIRKVASLVSMDRIYPNIYDTNARTRSGDVLRQIFDEDEKNIKICMDIFREAEDKNAKPKHIFGITVPPRGEVGIAFNTNSEIAKILLDKVPECKAVRTGQAFRKDDGMDVRLSADFIGDYFNKIMNALDKFTFKSGVVEEKIEADEGVKESASEWFDENGKLIKEIPEECLADIIDAERNATPPEMNRIALRWVDDLDFEVPRERALKLGIDGWYKLNDRELAAKVLMMAVFNIDEHGEWEGLR